MGIPGERRRIVHGSESDHEEGREQGYKESEQDGEQDRLFVEEPAEFFLCNDREILSFHPSHPRMKYRLYRQCTTVATSRPMTNHLFPPYLRHDATMSTPTKCRSSGSQSEPRERKRILPKIESEICAMVTKRRSFSTTRKPIAIAALARTIFFQLKNAGLRRIHRVDPQPFCELLDQRCKQQKEDERVRHGQVEEEHEAHHLHHEDKWDEKSLSRKSERNGYFGGRTSERNSRTGS